MKDIKHFVNETDYVVGIDNPKGIIYFLCITSKFYYVEPFVFAKDVTEEDEADIIDTGKRVIEKMLANGLPEYPVTFTKSKSPTIDPTEYLKA